MRRRRKPVPEARLRARRRRLARCWYCNDLLRGREITREHVLAKSAGGTDTVPACHRCNNLVGCWSVALKQAYRRLVRVTGWRGLPMFPKSHRVNRAALEQLLQTEITGEPRWDLP